MECVSNNSYDSLSSVTPRTRAALGSALVAAVYGLAVLPESLAAEHRAPFPEYRDSCAGLFKC